MSRSEGFPPVSRKDATILILGSMPGQKSLQENQYYAHPRNAFWPIIFRLLNVEPTQDYRQRKRLLIENKIALWDVLKSGYRPGSLDSRIDESTIEVNDFVSFLGKQKGIHRVYFNGATSGKLFRKYVLNDLEKDKYRFLRLPSTSPANAAMKFDEKLLCWKVIFNN